MPDHAALYAALAAAQQAIRGVEKDARNSYHKYDYTSGEAMIAAAKEALAGHGLAVFCAECTLSPATDASPCLVVATFRVCHEGGEYIDTVTHTPALPDNGRPLDKAVFGARTEALSYYLRDLLQIPRGLDDMEPSGRDDTQPRRAAAPAPHRQPQTAEGAQDTVSVGAVLKAAEDACPDKAERYERLNALCLFVSDNRVSMVKDLTADERAAALAEILGAANNTEEGE